MQYIHVATASLNVNKKYKGKLHQLHGSLPFGMHCGENTINSMHKYILRYCD